MIDFESLSDYLAREVNVLGTFQGSAYQHHNSAAETVSQSINSLHFKSLVNFTMLILTR
jgi:hypothetical protein